VGLLFNGGSLLLALSQLLLEILHIGGGSREGELGGPQFTAGEIQLRAGDGAKFAVEEIDTNGRAD